jgi:hypothetical protein
MARPRKKPAAEEIATNPEPKGSVAPTQSPDIFDQAIAAQQKQSAESPPTQEPPVMGFATSIKRPDPFDEMTIALSNSNEGPKMRLYRNQRFQQMAIQFDEKPDEAIRQKLRDDGWTWRGTEAAWTKQLTGWPNASQSPGIVRKCRQRHPASQWPGARDHSGQTPVSRRPLRIHLRLKRQLRENQAARLCPLRISPRGVYRH